MMSMTPKPVTILGCISRGRGDEDDDNEYDEHEFDDYKNTPTAASFG